jgi:hypothetical protein
VISKNEEDYSDYIQYSFSTSVGRNKPFQFSVTLKLCGIGICDSVDASYLGPHLSRIGIRSCVGDVHHLSCNLLRENIHRISKNSLSEGNLEPKTSCS